MIVSGARRAVFTVFALNGVLFASLVSRIPDVRADLGLDNGSLGLLLLALAVGSLVALPLSGRLIERSSPGSVVSGGAWVAAGGLVCASLGATVVTSVPVTALSLAVGGAGVGVWDVAMNVEGAEVERHAGRTIMPRFHAVFSLGAVSGALIAVPLVALGVPMMVHITLVAAVALAGVLLTTSRFLPAAEQPSGPSTSGSAWLEPRTLVIGVVVLGFALAEGSANDWLTLALVDGRGASQAVGVAGYALFVASMTVGRVCGPLALDRWGRAPTLWATVVLAITGLLVLVHGTGPIAVGVGIAAWGLGSSLGFPVGMSAAADDPVRSAARVSVVSTIGYAAFLAGPPLLGAVGDQVGTLESLQVVAVLLVPAMIAIAVLRTRSVEEGADVGSGDGR